MSSLGDTCPDCKGFRPSLSNKSYCYAGKMCFCTPGFNRYNNIFQSYKIPKSQGPQIEINKTSKYKPMTEDDYVLIARITAILSKEEYDYLPKTLQESINFVPHTWVIEAMKLAVKISKEK